MSIACTIMAETILLKNNLKTVSTTASSYYYTLMDPHKKFYKCLSIFTQTPLDRQDCFSSTLLASYYNVTTTLISNPTPISPGQYNVGNETNHLLVIMTSISSKPITIETPSIPSNVLCSILLQPCLQHLWQSALCIYDAHLQKPTSTQAEVATEVLSG